MSNNSFFGIFSFLRVGRKVSWTLRQNKIITFLFFLKYVKSVCKCLPPSINNHEKEVSVTKYVFYWITITNTYTGFPDRKDLHRISGSPRLTQDFRITKTYTGFPDHKDLLRISGSQRLTQDFRITKTCSGFPDHKDLHRISGSQRIAQDFRITKTYTGFPDHKDLLRISGSQRLTQDF